MNEDSDIYIEAIHIEDIRGVKNLDIPLSTTEKKHLILTGKNGSGKTSVLIAIENFLNIMIVQKQIKMRENYIVQNSLFKKLNLQKNANHTDDVIQKINASFEGIDLEFNSTGNILETYQSGEFIISYFEARRLSNFREPNGIRSIEFHKNYPIKYDVYKEFIQHIVNLKADKSFANDDNDTLTVKEIEKRFKNFEESLEQLFGYNIDFVFDKKNYNFNIIEPGKEPYTLNQLSDGYSAVLSIVADLIMRMEHNNTKVYNVQGIVLIDEIETHLHIDLQKKILPFLIAFFPKIQFIVTTHSPFVLSSIENAVICDLESRIIAEDFSSYTADSLVETYFHNDNYSDVIKKKVAEYEIYITKEGQRTYAETMALQKLEEEFAELGPSLGDELALKIQKLQLQYPNSITHDIL